MHEDEPDTPPARVLWRSRLPGAIVPMGAGVVVLGLTAYGFLIISARTLGPERYAPLSVLWALVFLVGPGLFYPLEQELTRAISAREATGFGSADLVRKAAVASGAAVAVLVVAIVAAGPWLLPRLFDDQTLLLAGLVLSVVGYFYEHLVRGVLAGTGKFTSYGVILGAEGALRLAGCLVLAALGVSSPGPYGLVLGATPLFAAAIGAVGHALLPPGPLPAGGERVGPSLTTALGWLLAASLFAQLLVNVAPVTVKLLATPEQAALVSRFVAGLIVARIPLFLFSAIQSFALPKLSGLAASGRFDDFRHVLLRLVGVVGGFAVAGILGVAVVGPTVLELLFGQEFGLARHHLVYLASASASYMLAMTVGQALIALRSQSRVAAAWLAGVVTFALVAALSSGLVERAERGLLAGSLVALGVMAAALLPLLPRGSRAETPAGTEPGIPPPAVT